MIKFSFRPLRGESPLLIRGAFFRICGDGSLRGPDNEIVAMYSAGIWRLCRRDYRSFECIGPVRLRCTRSEGVSEELGPFDSLSSSRGAIFAREVCLGAHARPGEIDPGGQCWREVVFLSGLPISGPADTSP